MNWRLNSKILATLWILVMLLAPMIWVVPMPAQAWTDPTTWYRTVPGVLAADYYKLYPFDAYSLKLGFSQFGELINGIDNVGLEYRTVDPFAPLAGADIYTPIPKNRWINGWLINISYTKVKGFAGEPRNVWASALHADLVDYEGPWLRVDYAGDWGGATYGWEDPQDPGYQIGNYASGLVWGGRKTNGTAVTQPLQVLYEGPRRFVALLNTTIYDHVAQASDDTSQDIALVEVLFTIIFNKDKKEVYILKDVKSIAPKVNFVEGSKMYIQFSNRGEVDLGNAAARFLSYAHFYVAGNGEGQPTPYDLDWITPADLVNYNTVPTVTPAASGGRSKHGPEPKATGTFDVAQVVNFAADKVFSAAFWPSLSNWEIKGDLSWWRSLQADDPNRVDMPTEPDPTPFYIGEWDFQLSSVLDKDIEFRGVTAYCVTDHWDATDYDYLYAPNFIDSEVQYHLNETFNPEDLYKANPFLKNYAREVEFFSGTGSQTVFSLSHVANKPTWDQYCVFAERVLVNLVLQVPNRAIPPHSSTYHYEIVHIPEGEPPYTHSHIVFDHAPPAGTNNIKVLYSWDINATGTQGRYEWIIVGRDSAAVDSAGAAMLGEGFDMFLNTTEHLGGLDMKDTVWGARVPFLMNEFRPGYGTVAVRPTTPVTVQDSRANYRDALFKTSSGKSALLDDWCTIRAVSSSNIITVGSPYANHLTEYFNEFTDAYLDVGYAEDGGLLGNLTSTTSGKIVPLSCWDKLNKVHGVGYAVVATYKDLNGTVGCVVWGHAGQDTFYACKWLWDTGLQLLATSPYKGVTAVVLAITYPTTACPSASIVETLGTISELGVHVDPPA